MEKTKVIIVKWKESKGQKERRKKSSFKSSKHKTKNVGKVVMLMAIAMTVLVIQFWLL